MRSEGRWSVGRWSVLAGLSLAILSAACASDATKPKYDRQIALFGYLYVGEAVSDTNGIRLERTRPVDEYYDPEQALIRNAVVTLRADSAAVADTLPMTQPGIYANPEVVIRERTTYHLTATIDGTTVTATTTTPLAFETPREPRTVDAGAMRQSVIADSFPIVVTCPDPAQVFLVDCYCQENWQVARFIHRFGSDETPQSYDEYGGDNGPPRHLNAFFRLRDVRLSDEGYRLSFYGDMMWFYGRYEIGVFSIDDNYYNYLYRDHPELSGGVAGGIGVFGSACRKRYPVRVVE